MSFLAAIPIIGELFKDVGDAIDKNVTTDDERLKAKATLTALFAPVIQSIVSSQIAFAELQAKIAEIEARSEHWLVWARRPVISILATANFMVTLWLWMLTMPKFNAIFSVTEVPAVVQFAFYFAMGASGLDMTTRGIEKAIKAFKSKEEI